MEYIKKYRIGMNGEENWMVINEETKKPVFYGSFISCYLKLERLMLNEPERTED
jgi:hypothetical protein